MITKQEIMDILPHIRYIAAPKSKTVEMYYIGGEPEENDKRLTINNNYLLYQALYAENREDKRKLVWVCRGDENGITIVNRGKVCQIDRKNFSPYPPAKRRDIKLDKILK